MIVYKISNTINNKIYIGITKKTLKQRWSRHGFAKSSKNMAITYAILKYGKENFIAEEICSALNIESLKKLEIYFIEYYTNIGFELYNVKKGGNYNPQTAEETKKKLSEIGKTLIGNKNPFYGKKHTEETKKILSEKCKNNRRYIRTEKHLKRISEVHKGKHVSEETKLKISKPLICLNNGKIYKSARCAAKDLNVHYTLISMVLKGKRKHTKGFTFKYLEKFNG